MSEQNGYLNRTDRKIIGTAIVVFSIALYFTVFDSWLTKFYSADTSNFSAIGEVTDSQNDVRRRFKVAFSWLPLDRNQTVFQGDSIFTGDNSNAVVKTYRGEEIQIAANSLVVIDFRDESLFLDIDYGNIRGRVNENQKLLVASANGVTELSGSEALLDIDVRAGKNLVVKVIEGEVKLNIDGKNSTLNRDEAAELKSGGEIENPNQVDIVPTGPLAKKEIHSETEKDLALSWKSNYSFKEYEIEISDTQDFSNVIVKKQISGKSFKTENLPQEKTLYWRVKAQAGDKKGKSPVSKIKIVKNEAPALVSPALEQEIEIDLKKDPDINLQWQGSELVSDWNVEVSKDPEFSNASSMKASEFNQSFKPTTPGTYYWRVRRGDLENAKWSPPSKFVLKTPFIKPLVAPAWDKAPKEFVLSFDKNRLNPKSAPRLEWREVDGADGYELEVSRLSSFKTIGLKTRVDEPKFTWQDVKPGHYFARVKSFRDKQLGPMSETREFTVNIAPPASLSLPVIEEKVEEFSLLDLPPPPFEFQWSTLPYAATYEFEFSDNASLKDPLRQLVGLPQNKIQTKKAGTYYWRVRALDKDNAPISDFSPVYSLVYSRVYSNPEKVSELKTLYPKAKQSILLIGDGSDRIQFVWSKPFNDVVYRVQISQDQKFATLLHEKVLTANKMFVDVRFPPGWTYWRVRAENRNINTPWSPLSAFELIYQRQSYDPETPVKTQELVDNAVPAAEPPRLTSQEKDIPLETPKVKPSVKNYLLKASKEREPAAISQNGIVDLKSDAPIFSWEAVNKANSYAIEIAKDESFSQKIIMSSTVSTQWQWNNPQPGEFYWRVAAQDKKRAKSEFSNAQKIDIRLPVPQATSADQFVEFFPTRGVRPNSPSAFFLEWTPLPYFTVYELQFSKDAQFKDVKIIKTHQSKTKVKVSKEGTYYWKVRGTTNTGRALTEFSTPRSITVLSQTRDIASVPGLEPLFPSAGIVLKSHGSEPEKIKFRWQSGGTQGNYTVQIARDQNFAKPLFEGTSSRLELLVSQDLPEGTLYWRVGTIEEGKATWTPPVAFEVNH